MPLRMGTVIPAPTPATRPPTRVGGSPVVWTPGRGGVQAMRWTTWDGTVWDVMTGHDSLFLCEGMQGLGGMTQTEYVSAPAEADGQFYRGGRFGPRQVFWPTLLWNGPDTGTDFTTWLERWNSGLSYSRPGVWEVRDERGVTRRLRLRLVDPGDDYDRDPARRGWAALGTKLVADQPHWEGDPVTRAFGTDQAPITMFDKAPQRIIRITSGSTLSRATIANPGQVESWPTWLVYGPCDSASIGVGSSVVTIPFHLGANEVFKLDTTGGSFTSLVGTIDPVSGVPTSWTDVVQRLSSWDIVPIQPGQTTNLSVTVTGGTGYVRCDLTPLYFRGVA